MTAPGHNATESLLAAHDERACRSCGKPAVRNHWFWYLLAAVAAFVFTGPDPRVPQCRDCRHATVALMLIVGMMLLPFAFIIYTKSH